MAVPGAILGWGVVLAVGSVTAAIVVNSVMGDYDDSKGHAYGAASNTTSVSLAAVATALVAPKQTAPNSAADGAASGSVAVRTFTITNDSNISDAYVISALTVSAGSIQSVAFTPVGSAPIAATVGTTVSPVRQPGASINVAVSIATLGAPVGTNIAVALTAKTTAASANGAQSDTGEAWVVVARGPQIVGTATPMPNVPNPAPAAAGQVPVADLVNGGPSAQAEPGATVAFDIPFKNIGGSPAFGVVMTDQIPAQISPVAGSLKLETTDPVTGKSAFTTTGVTETLNGNTLTATIAQLNPGVIVSVSFQATIGASAAIGTSLENPATITAQSVSKFSAVPAVVFVGAMNTVFNALGGSADPIAGAQVSLLDAAGGAPAKFTAGGTAVNRSNANPFAATPAGVFGFGLPVSLGEHDYDLDVRASGFLNRKIKVAEKTGSDGLPTTTLSALDGLPLAVAGGFGLTANPVTVSGVSGFFGNVPMFSPRIATLTASVDRTVASAGDRLGYTIVFGPGSRPLAYPADLSIQLPPGVAYAHGSARLGGTALEPVAAGSTLAWPLQDVSVSRTLVFDAVVLPSVTQGATAVTRAALTVKIAGAPVATNATVDVAIVGGALGARTILSGRVFADHGGDGHFMPGDLGLSGVRIFLEDGESAQTDLDGRFSFPAARPGMHVLHLDPSTLPAGTHPYHGFAVNDPRSTMQLVHGIFDSGLMSDVNFAISDGPGR